jgi:hypothetical protein
MFSSREELNRDFKDFLDSYAGVGLSPEITREAMTYIDKGADACIQDAAGQTLLHKLLANNKDGANNEVIKKIISIYPETLKIQEDGDKQGLTPIHLMLDPDNANASNRRILADLLLNNKKNISNETILSIKNRLGKAALEYVLEQFILPPSTEIPKERQNTLINTTEILVDAGANPSKIKINGWTLLHKLIYENVNGLFDGFIKKLIALYPEMLTIQTDKSRTQAYWQGNTPLHDLVEVGENPSKNAENRKLIFQLLQNSENPLDNVALLKIKNSQGETPLEYILRLAATFLESKEEIIEAAMILVRAGANPNSKAGEITLLHLLVINNKDKKYDAYINDLVRNYGADINIENSRGLTPLEWLIATKSRCKMSAGKLYIYFYFSRDFDTEMALLLLRLNAYIFRSKALSDYCNTCKSGFEFLESRSSIECEARRDISSFSRLRKDKAFFVSPSEQEKAALTRIAEARAKAIIENIKKELVSNDCFSSIRYTFLYDLDIDGQKKSVTKPIYYLWKIIIDAEKNINSYTQILQGIQDISQDQNGVYCKATIQFLNKINENIEKHFHKDTALNQSKFIMAQEERIREEKNTSTSISINASIATSTRKSTSTRTSATTNTNKSTSTSKNTNITGSIKETKTSKSLTLENFKIQNITEDQAKAILIKIRKCIKTYDFGVDTVKYYASFGNRGGRKITWSDKSLKTTQDKIVPNRVAAQWEALEFARHGKLTCLDALQDIINIGAIAAGLAADESGLLKLSDNSLALKFYLWTSKLGKSKQAVQANNNNNNSENNSYTNILRSANTCMSTINANPFIASDTNSSIISPFISNNNTSSTTNSSSTSIQDSFYATNNTVFNSNSSNCNSISKNARQHPFAISQPINLNMQDASLVTQYGTTVEPSAVFICPLSREIMKDPVILVESGQTYERWWIVEWLKDNNTDPLSNSNITSKALTPNVALKSLIQVWLEKNPHYAMQQTQQETFSKQMGK